MKDRIDEINERKRIGSSIIKSWNVRYIPVSAEPAKNESDEIIARLKQNAEDEERKKREAVYEQVEAQMKEDAVRQDQIEKILKDKRDVVREVMEQIGDTGI